MQRVCEHACYTRMKALHILCLIVIYTYTLGHTSTLHAGLATHSPTQHAAKTQNQCNP